MGKQVGGLFANWYGKVGNVVGRIRQNRTIVSIYQPNVANPRSDAQVDQRSKFSLLAAALSHCSGFLKYGFHDLDGYKTGNYYSAAIGYNMKLDGVFTGVAPDYELDYGKIVMSQGNVDLPYSPSASAEGATVTFTWSDNSGMGNALASDKIAVLAYNPTKGQSVYNPELADRSERNGTLALPTAWVGDTVMVYLAVFRKLGECSMSTEVGALPL